MSGVDGLPPDLSERPNEYPDRKEMERAWERAVDALEPRQRLVLWQDRDGPVFIQVLEVDPHYDGETNENMRVAMSELAAYPSKGIGTIADGLHTIAARLESTT